MEKTLAEAAMDYLLTTDSVLLHESRMRLTDHRPIEETLQALNGAMEILKMVNTHPSDHSFYRFMLITQEIDPVDVTVRHEIGEGVFLHRKRSKPHVPET